MSLLDIRRVVVPQALVGKAHAHLARVGRQGLEGFALWAGVRDGTVLQVRETIIPAQKGIRVAGGVCVTVDGVELHRINVWLYEHDLTLGAQLHSHPTEAYHSETDDAYPIATTAGSLSLVVPDFARRPFHLADCAVYRLVPTEGWVELSVVQAATLLTITE